MTDQPTPADRLKEHWQITITVVLLLGLAGLVFFLMATSDVQSEIVWQRRIFVFAGVEALVFTAIGWLFGREVSRSAVANAQKDAAIARTEAAEAKQDARQLSEATTEAKVQAATVQTRAETAAAVVDNIVGAGGTESSGGSVDAGFDEGEEPAGPAATVDLQRLFRQLYPHRPPTGE